MLKETVNNEEKVQKVSETALPNSEEEAIIRTSDGNADDFQESDHPRDEEGKFASTGGSGSNSSGEPKTAKTPKPSKPTKFSRSGDTMEVAKDTRIKIGSTQNRTVMVAGSLTGVQDFAGVSGKKAVEKEPELLKQYPNSKQGSWKHSLGYGKVRRGNGKLQDAEIHWFESDDVGQVGWKVKRFGKGGDD